MNVCTFTKVVGSNCQLMHDGSTECGMAFPRYLHTATRLDDGKVLIVGGTNAGGATVASAEIFNPTTGAFQTTASLATSRYGHTATLLSNGLVLVAGGATPSPGGGNQTYLGTAELYNPAAGSFSATMPMQTTRYLHSATLLPNGEVLVAGYPSRQGAFFTSVCSTLRR